MNLQQNTPNDWTVYADGKEVFIHKNDDGTFTNRVKQSLDGQGSLAQPVGNYPDLDFAYVAAQAYCASTL